MTGSAGEAGYKMTAWPQEYCSSLQGKTDAHACVCTQAHAGTHTERHAEHQDSKTHCGRWRSGAGSETNSVWPDASEALQHDGYQPDSGQIHFETPLCQGLAVPGEPLGLSCVQLKLGGERARNLPVMGRGCSRDDDHGAFLMLMSSSYRVLQLFCIDFKADLAQ